MLSIHRVDRELSSTNCWRVTIQRRTKLFTRDFSDGVHGGRDQALQAALANRDTVIEAHPPLSKPDYGAILKKNNRSELSGVPRVDGWGLSRGRRIRRLDWEVQRPIENGRSRHRKFSILKYGGARIVSVGSGRTRNGT